MSKLFYLFLCLNLVSCTVVVCEEYYKDTEVIKGTKELTKENTKQLERKYYEF